MNVTQFNGENQFQEAKDRAGRYAIVLMVTCIFIPIVSSLVHLLSLPSPLYNRILAHIDSPVLGNYHAVPFVGLGFVPTRGQALFIAYIWTANVVFSAIAYPQSAFKGELASLIGYRVGLFSFVNLALAVLCSSRNNVLLYLTNWSHSTFLLLHRWTAVIGILQACLHSAIFFHKYQDGEMGGPELIHKRYWIWGVIAFISIVAIMPASVLPFRRRVYEAFLASHIVLSALILTGCSLHIFYRYGWLWEYQAWITAAFGVWGFDFLLARPLRMIRNGLREAQVSVIDPDYLMIRIPDVEAEGYVYLYFPFLSWRAWENHPFSVAAVSYCPPPPSSPLSASDYGTPAPEVREKNGLAVYRATRGPSSASHAPGIVFFVRRRGGLTRKLCGQAGDVGRLRVLVESSYGTDMSLFRRRRSGTCPKYPNLVCLAGGVGITAIMPLINTNSSSSGKTELYWGARSASLVQAVAQAVGQRADITKENMLWGHTNVSILVGRRFDFKFVLENAVRRMNGGITVAICGPPGMADEVRSIVTGLGKKGVLIKLREESFVR